MGSLSAKAALVTRGPRDTGPAIAKRLAEDGADVIISYAAAEDKAQAVVRVLQTATVRAAVPLRSGGGQLTQSPIRPPS